MKYLLLIGDGMGDYPIDSLGGKTPLEYAETPNLDYMAQNGRLGVAQTVPEGMIPGSDVAIMSLMGFYPKGILTGRGPLEAASLGIELGNNELAFRLNFINVEHQGDQILMRNHSAGNLTTAEGIELLEALAAELPLNGQRLHPGVSFRHVLVWPDQSVVDVPSRPPHDYRDKDLTPLLNDQAAAPLTELVKASWAILEKHPVNEKRRAAGLPTANSIWLWGHGAKPQVKTYQERWGVSGAAISAVDLIKGLGKVTGLSSPEVPGATGWVDTNYAGKVAEARKTWAEGGDFAIVHLEAPDETSHQGELDLKIEAISAFDAQVVGPLLEALRNDYGEFRILAACDHYTPIALMTHTSDPVPFIIYEEPVKGQGSGLPYTETAANSTGLRVDPGADLGILLFGTEK